MIAVTRVFGLVDVAVEHRRGRRDPGKVRGARAAQLELRARRLSGEREEREDRERGAGGAAQLEPADARPLAELARGPVDQRSVSLARVGLVVEREHLRPARFTHDESFDGSVGRQHGATAATRLDERPKVAAVLVPRVVAVVVRDRRGRVERLDEREVQLTAVARSGLRATLVDGVEKVPDRLKGDEKSQQVLVTSAREGPEQSRTVRVSALAPERAQRVLAQRFIGDRVRTRDPAVDLRGYRVQAPDELACRGAQ